MFPPTKNIDKKNSNSICLCLRTIVGVIINIYLIETLNVRVSPKLKDQIRLLASPFSDTCSIHSIVHLTNVVNPSRIYLISRK